MKMTMLPLMKPLSHYALALALMALAIVVRWLTDPIFDNNFRLIFLYGAIAFAVWRGGMGPALLVTLVGYAISNYLFMGTMGAFDLSADAGVGFAAYLFSCSIFIGLGEASRRANARFKDSEESRARLAAIVTASDDAIVSKGLDGVIRSWNAGAERLFGYTEAEMVGKPIYAIIPPELHDEEVSIIRRIRRGERVAHFETERVTKGGQRIGVSITVSPLFDHAGRVIGASKIARDITERKRSEQALQQADQRKDEFLATLAHELRNPLAPISHSLEILKHADRDPTLLPQARGAIERQLSHMVRLVDDLLNVSRISQDKLTLRTSQTAVAAVIQQAVETAVPLVEEYGHSLAVSLPEEPIYLNADPVRLAQVLTNLLNNACKYTKPGGDISITAELLDHEACITVKDSGIGIAPDQLESVFEMFQQVDRTLDHSTGGLGIGLTLAKQLVEMHGGQLTVHSDGIGCGSAFTVRLPVPTAAATGQQAAPAPTTVEPTAQRILVVDDNIDGAETLATLLELKGHELQVAHDGLAAVEAAERFRPSLILLDIGLPKLDGYGACRRIRQTSWGAHITIVALTGWGQEEDQRKSGQAGFDAHLVKPVDYSAVSQLLSAQDNLAVN